ncbi:MAG: GNAT family N-acetyltransferase [Chitinophagales bacterium]
MKFSFRKATENDIALINDLANKIWREHYPSIISLEQINFMLHDRYSPEVIKAGMSRGEQYYLAFAGDEPLALAAFELKDKGYFLHKFYVDVSRHRNGVGSAFFNYLLQQMKPDIPIRLQVNRQNYKAVNFYFKMGFAIEKVGDFDIGGGFVMNDFVMLRPALPV